MTLRFAHGLLVCLVLGPPLAALARDAGPLSVQGSGPYYTLALPMMLRAQSASNELDDLRVLNAQGEPLPFAWAEPPTAVLDEQSQRLPFFKLPPAPQRQASAAPGSAADVGWMIDARGVKGSLTGLELELPEGARGVYTLALDASDDLQQWHALQPSLQIVSLQQQGLRLRSTHVELEGQRPAYLRLRVLTGSAVPVLKGVQARSVSQAWRAPPLQWSEPIEPLQCDAQHCDYALPRRIPLEQVQWQLAEVNTLAGVLMLGALEPGGAAAAHRHRLRDKVRALRRKTEEAASAPPPRALSWHAIMPATLYWLRVGGADVRTGTIALDGGHYDHLRLQPDAAMNLLGGRPPTLRIAARTRSLVFLARGPAPYRLAWADPINGQRPGNMALPLDQLIPTRKAGDPLPSDSASVLLPAEAPTAAAASTAATNATDSALSRISGRPWLWAVLIGGAALMGAMALSLLRGRGRR